MGILNERFDEKVMPEPNSGCWLWSGALKHGYGWFWHEGKPRYAHVLSYESEHGPLPDGLERDHRCRVRCCVNPAHMEPVTHAVNVQRGEAGQYQRGPKEVCRKGLHKMTPENTYVGPSNGVQHCRECRRAWRQRRAG